MPIYIERKESEGANDKSDAVKCQQQKIFVESLWMLIALFLILQLVYKSEIFNKIIKHL